MGGLSRYRFVVYILLSAKTRPYLCKSMAVPMGGISRYFSKVSGSGVNATFLRRTFWEGDATKHFSVKKWAFQWKGEGSSVNGGLLRISTGKAIQWRGPGHSVNRQTLKTEKLLSSSWQSALSLGHCADLKYLERRAWKFLVQRGL